MTLPSLISRVLALLIAAAYLVAAYFAVGFQFDLYIIGTALLLPLSFIWFPEHWEEYMGPLGHGTRPAGRPRRSLQPAGGSCSSACRRLSGSFPTGPDESV